MDIQDILKRLPHRYPFLLIDRVVEIEKGKRIVAIKNVTADEPVFEGTQRFMLPGMLLLEAMAQATGLLHFHSIGKEECGNTLIYFVGIDGVRIRRVVIPGDQIVIEATIDRVRGGIHTFHGTATVDGHLVTKAKLMSTMREA